MASDIQQALAQLVAGQDLSREAMSQVMRVVMGGEASDAQIGALLVALRIKGESIDEIAGAAQVMRELALPVRGAPDNAVDLVGTGGDGANLFNVSTAATFVAAAAGAPVAKHGNRSVSSTSGSSDVLEAFGVALDLAVDQVERALAEVGMCFMFAPVHHAAMRHAIGPRRELGMRSVFNLLGPLTNPAGVKRQVVGVFDPSLCRPLAEVLQSLGSVQVMVVHSEDGLDEISIAAPTQVAELRAGSITEYQISPEDFGIERRSLDELSVSSAEQSVALIRAAFAGNSDERASKAADIIALNAGAAIYVSGEVATLADGVALAQDVLGSGQAAAKLEEFVNFTQTMRALEA